MTYDAVVLAGGAATRLGGVDKMLLRVGEERLLDRALAAVAGAGRTVVVGPPRPVARAVLWAREEPPGGGPVAALAAGLAHVQADVVVLLAADLPFVSPDVIRRLVGALAADGPADGVLLVDGDGRDQPLLSAWRTQRLREVVPAEPAGHGLSRTLSGLLARRLAAGSETLDCDTPDDLTRARRLAGAAGRAEPEERNRP